MSTTLLARRRRTGGAAPFAPTDIAGLQEWFAADSITGLSDGDPVSTWPDDSGNARDATQAGGARPTYKTNILNSLPVVRFSAASSQRMVFTAHTGFTAVSIFIVFNRASTSGDHALLSVGNTLMRLDMVGGGQLEWWPDTDTTVIDTHNVSTATWYLASILQSSTSYDVRLDLTSSAGTTVAVDGANQTDAIGSFLGGTTWPFDGDIAEIVVYDSDLSDTDRDLVEAYLQGKWGL